MNFKQRTQNLLRRQTRPMRQIALEAGVGYEWLAKFKHDRINDPGVERVERLYRHLIEQDQDAV